MVDEDISIAIAELRAASRRRSTLAHGTSEFDAAIAMEESAARRVRDLARRADAKAETLTMRQRYGRREAR